MSLILGRPQRGGQGGKMVPRPQVGLLVMAHGGSTGWNEDVARAVAPLKARVPTALAFGMADSTTLAAGLDSLRARGANRIVLVRVFVSGDSFLERTARLLQIDIGLGDSPQPGAFIDHGLAVATHLDGLADWAGITEIVVDRASRVSAQPNRHSVLLFAHGQGDDDHNTRLLQRMEQTAAALRDRGFQHVRAITLREDWPSLRRAAPCHRRYLSATMRSVVDGLACNGADRTARNGVWPPLGRGRCTRIRNSTSS